MPKKKNTLSDNFNLSRLNLSESYVSLALGVVVVIVIAAVLFLLLKSANKGGVNLTNIKTVIEEQLGKKAIEEAPKDEDYTVKEGDTLFLITQKKYGDGYKYLEVAMLNKISNPDQIEVGNKIKLPEKLETTAAKTYEVKDGDTLWDIAVKNYGDGFRWVEIASTNNLANPDWILVGQKLNLP